MYNFRNQRLSCTSRPWLNHHRAWKSPSNWWSYVLTFRQTFTCRFDEKSSNLLSSDQITLFQYDCGFSACWIAKFNRFFRLMELTKPFFREFLPLYPFFFKRSRTVCADNFTFSNPAIFAAIFEADVLGLYFTSLMIEVLNRSVTLDGRPNHGLLITFPVLWKRWMTLWAVNWVLETIFSISRVDLFDW